MKAVEKRGWTPYNIALLNSYAWSNEVRESKVYLEDNTPLKGNFMILKQRKINFFLWIQSRLS